MVKAKVVPVQCCEGQWEAFSYGPSLALIGGEWSA